MMPRAAAAALLLALFACAAPRRAGGAQDDVFTGTQCVWDTQASLDGPTCDISPVFVVSQLLDDVPNNFAKLTLQVFCNRYADADTCTADATCSYDPTMAPPCTMDSAAYNSNLTQLILCPGAPMASMLPCNWASNTEADCSAAVAQGNNCTWSNDTMECLPAAVAAMDEAQLADYYARYGSWAPSLWGDCEDLKAYVAYVNACGSGDGTTADACSAYGAACQWVPTQGRCVQTPVATLVAAFGLDPTTDPTVAAQLACGAVNASEACVAVGDAVTVSEALVEAARAGDIALTGADTGLNDTIDTSGPQANATDGANTTHTAAHTGAAAAAAAGPAALLAALLLGALLA